MASENWFRKGKKFAAAPARQTNAAVPDGLVLKCSGCGEILFKSDFERSLKVCTKCGHHHRMSASERIESVVDEGSFAEMALDLVSRDFLKFPDYQDKLDKAWAKLGTADSFRIGTAHIDGARCVLGVSDFGFMGGSMGSVAGEKIALALEEGVKLRLPVVLFTTSGGARMQEGLMSLMQMAKTSAAAARLADARLPLIIVMTDPTTAGVMASYASLGDVLLAEPGALIAFTGQRVAAQAAQGQKLPANYQTSEWRLERGHIDSIVQRRELQTTLGRLLRLLQPAALLEPEVQSESVSPKAKRNGNGHTAVRRTPAHQGNDAKISQRA